MGTYKISFVTAVILSMILHASISQGAAQLLSWPLDEAVKQSQSNAALKSYELRKGQIIITPEFLQGPTGTANRKKGIGTSKGDTVSIGLFIDVSYEVTVDSVSQHKNGTKVITGKLKDHVIGTVVVTIGPEAFIITVQDMNRSMMYRVIGDSHQGSGTVTEIDMNKMPPMIR